MSSEQLEEIDDRLAVVDVSPTSGARVVRFWVDEVPLQEETIGRNRAPPLIEQGEMETPVRRPNGAGCSRESPDFGGGVDYHDQETPSRERLPDDRRESPPRIRQNNTGMFVAFYGTTTGLVLQGSRYDISSRV